MSRIPTFIQEFCEISNTNAAETTALGAETSDFKQTAGAKAANYDKFVAVALATNVVSTHVLTLQLYEGTDTDDAGTTISGATDTYTSAASATLDVLKVEINTEDLTSGKTHVSARVTTDDADGTEFVTILLMPMNPRYGQATAVSSAAS